MLLEIAQYGNPVLKEKCRPVEHFDDGLKALAENMLETMYAAEGIGLAAPQVSIPIQLVVIDIPEEEELTATDCWRDACSMNATI